MSRVKPSFWIFLANKTWLGNKKFLLFWCFGALLVLGNSLLLLSFMDTPSIHSYFPVFIFSMLTLLVISFGLGLFFQWRIFRGLISIFENAIEINGKVVDVYFSGSRGYITCEYQYQQEIYRSTDAVFSDRKINRVFPGQQVVLYINQEKTTQAFIRDLYLNTF